ncbi:class I SAM-dependent methyltransferase [Phreatobacter stygius]|uniref:Class I SAM-dependent methyltransferase n=1 Tax=Phreatobacter stygius TaxID=1940610 RepID=A0A4D7B131_9HYPH|nr:class I SAM-dependent methyltransferase [Phreatobacter stygius]QCI63186.1 class I SAM-dependent methyltransferase [Phreatobacter stygius]
MSYREFVSLVHKSTKRDYLARVTERDKAEVSELALEWGHDYWDGSRQTGYGGYRYDGRWRKVADAMVAAYGIKPGMRILDVGAGKGFLLHDFTESVPGVEVHGIDVSGYAIEHAMESVKDKIVEGTAAKLPFPDGHFDLVISINTLHNLYVYDLFSALGEMERVSRGAKYLCVEAYRNEREKMNLMYWQLTCRAFHTPQEWEWIFGKTGYTGDHEFITFE